MRWIAAILLTLGLAACEVAPLPQTAPQTTPRTAPRPVPQTTPAVAVDTSPRLPAGVATRNFVDVLDDVGPVAERQCRALTRGVNCDYTIVVDDRANLPPNAFQTLDKNGNPVIGFTLQLIAEARNKDELAFILGHEAAHHIAGHLDRTRQSAVAGAVLAGVLAQATGADAASIRTAQNFGATVGARRFSKDYELEADAIGARIAQAAGYDAVRGAQYFSRAPDPGNQFLGTHPPNAQRIQTVRAAVGR